MKDIKTRMNMPMVSRARPMDKKLKSFAEKLEIKESVKAESLKEWDFCATTAYSTEGGSRK